MNQLDRLLKWTAKSATDRETIGVVYMAHDWEAMARKAEQYPFHAEWGCTDEDDRGYWLHIDDVNELPDNFDPVEWDAAYTEVAEYWGLEVIGGKIVMRSEQDPTDPPPWRFQQREALHRVIRNAQEYAALTPKLADLDGKALSDAICRRLDLGRDTREQVGDWLMDDPAVLSVVRTQAANYAGPHFVADFCRDRITEEELFRGLA